MQNLELQRAHSAEQRDADEGVGLFVRLHHAFLQQLREPLAEALEVRGRIVVQKGKALRSESRHFAVGDGCIFGKRVADEEVIVPHEAHDVAGIRFVHGLAIAGEKAL